MVLHKIAVENLKKGKSRTTKERVCLSHHALSARDIAGKVLTL